MRGGAVHCENQAMEITGEEVLEWADRNGFALSEWQRELIRRAYPVTSR